MGNAYTGISSMMPQKRNPCILERMRTTASLVLGKCHACMIAQHNTEWEGNLEIATTPSLINESLKQSRDLLYLLRNQMAMLALDEALLNKRTMESCAVMTELADALVRNTGMDYRTAHHIVSALADECTSQRLLVSEITAEHIARHFRAVTCRDINIPAETLLQSLDARRCVETRAVCGGPAAKALDAALDKLEHRLDKAGSRQARRVQRLRDSHVELEKGLQQCDSIDIDLINLILQGVSYEAISERLFISIGSLRYRVSKLYANAGTENRKQFERLFKLRLPVEGAFQPHKKQK